MKINMINLIITLLFLLLLIKPSKQTLSNPNNITASIEGTDQTRAILTLNGFQKGESGGQPSECDGNYHDDNENIVALSTQWYDHGKMCFKCITTTRDDGGRGSTTMAKVVDECDVSGGCRKNVVDGSKAVWKALGVDEKDPSYGGIPVTWGMC